MPPGRRRLSICCRREGHKSKSDPLQRRCWLSPSRSHCSCRKKVFCKCLQEAPSGSASILRVCLDDGELLQLLHLAAQDFARPAEVARLFMMATITAIRKSDGGVRDIATGTVFRRLVAKCLSRQYIAEVEKVCAPFQFAMSTRAGTDCVGHAVRAMTDFNPHTTVLSVDGVGAYDHVLRSSKLHEVESLRCLLPFVRSVYSHPSTYHWQEEGGHRR